MPEDHRIEMPAAEMALLHWFGIYPNSFGLGCSPGRQRRTLNTVALVSQLCKLVKEQASAAADLKNSACHSHQGVNTCRSFPSHPRDKRFHGRNEFDVVGTVVSLRVLCFQSGRIGLWNGFPSPTALTSANEAIALIQSSVDELISTTGNADSDGHRAQLNCLYLTNPHLNSRYLMMVRRIDRP
jgi:hypothetical protein